MLRVEGRLAAAHADFFRSAPKSNGYLRKAQVCQITYGQYADQLLRRLSKGPGEGEGERGGAEMWRDYGPGGERKGYGGRHGSDGYYSRGNGAGAGGGSSAHGGA
jgi:hypothetical protein